MSLYLSRAIPLKIKHMSQSLCLPEGDIKGPDIHSKRGEPVVSDLGVTCLKFSKVMTHQEVESRVGSHVAAVGAGLRV